MIGRLADLLFVLTDSACWLQKAASVFWEALPADTTHISASRQREPVHHDTVVLETKGETREPQRMACPEDKGASAMEVDSAQQKLPEPAGLACRPDREAAISMLPPLVDRLSCDSCDKDIKYVSAYNRVRWFVRRAEQAGRVAVGVEKRDALFFYRSGPGVG